MSIGLAGFLMVASFVVVSVTSLTAWLALGGMRRSARARDERLEVLHEEVEQLMRALPDLPDPEHLGPHGRRYSRGSRRRRRARRHSWWREFFGFDG